MGCTWALMLMLGVSVTNAETGGGRRQWVYPQTQREAQVDTYHGVTVADPYRWLEQDVRTSAAVRDWVTAQNELTFGYLRSLPGREAIEQRLTSLWNYPKVGVPFHKAGRTYIARNDGLQNHFVIYVMERLGGDERVLFNPNTWSEDGTLALGGMAFSPDGRYVAYGIQEAGSDWRTWKVRDIERGKDLPDTLRYLKFTNVAWAPNSRGLYFAKYPDPDPNERFQSLNRNMRVMHHALGTEQSADRVVYARPEHPDWGYSVEVSDDGRFLVNSVWVGTDPKYRILVRDLHVPDAPWVDLVDTFENEYRFIDNVGPLLYFFTDAGAPKGRVVAVDVRPAQARRWRPIIPEREAPLQGVNLVDDRLICSYLEDVVTRVRVHDREGRFLRDVDLPGPGTATGFGGQRSDTETFFRFESYTVPPTIYRYDLRSGRATVLAPSQVDIDPADYQTERVFYRSQDGTRVPLFVCRRRDLDPNRPQPTLLYGYGGFNISLLPRFSVKSLLWMEQGGVYAVANLRGGGEYGRTWHEAGKREHKQNVFDDFIAAAEYLVAQGMTTPSQLAIHGGSNGGLLVGACMTQRPELFAAAVPAVGVMDMLRFDAFTAGRFWTDDYGSAQESRAMFDVLRAYSPYHNLRPGTDYPATLVLTADTDDRVVPGHSFKFAAELQRCQAGPDPVLIRIETRAGHGSGKPTAMLIEEIADMMAFLGAQLGMQP